jgi:predicted amidophosphoribosyltransferase
MVWPDGVQLHSKQNLDTPIILVPVPNSSCCTQNDDVPRTVALAEAIVAEQTYTSVLDCLRWTREMESASKEGGTRDPQELYDNLVLTERLPEKGAYLLVDDMKTTGGHLQAARFMLLEQEVECDLAICGGRTVWDHDQNPFSMAEEEIDDWSPHPTLY